MENRAPMKIKQLDALIAQQRAKLQQLESARELLSEFDGRIGRPTPRPARVVPPKRFERGELREAVLGILQDGGERSPAEIAVTIGSRNHTVAQTLLGLRENGLVRNKGGKWSLAAKGSQSKKSPVATKHHSVKEQLLTSLADGKLHSVASLREQIGNADDVSRRIWDLVAKGKVVREGRSVRLKTKGARRQVARNQTISGRLMPGQLKASILDILSDGGERGPAEIAALAGTTPGSVFSTLTILRAAGEVNRHDGKWFAIARAKPPAAEVNGVAANSAAAS